MKLPLARPKPDIETFVKVIKGEKIPSRMHFAELFMDYEVIRHIAKEVLGLNWIDISKDKKSREAYWMNYIEVFYRLGYDYVRISGNLNFQSKIRTTNDSAALSKGTRKWVEEATGIITKWEDFEKYPWPVFKESDLWDYEFVSSHLPEGMGMFVCPTNGFLEVAMQELIGYEKMCYMLYEDTELVGAVFNKVGEIICNFYKNLLGLPNLAGFFQGDDMGFKHSTILSPKDLKKFVLPWHKCLSDLTHENGMLYMLHSCGKLDEIMEDLIEDVKIDAKHSFEDEATSVIDFKKKYGDRVAVLGGVDIDKLCRIEGDELHNYVGGIIDACMSGGRYALGSGNSISNYVPLDHYFIMLEEGLKWNRH